jgi:hypothetical protein
MNSQYRQPRVFQGHAEPASLLALTPIHRRIEELRQERALVDKAMPRSRKSLGVGLSGGGKRQKRKGRGPHDRTWMAPR